MSDFSSPWSVRDLFIKDATVVYIICNLLHVVVSTPPLARGTVSLLTIRPDSPRVVFATDTVDVDANLRNGGGNAPQWELVRVVLAEIARDTYGIMVRCTERVAPSGHAPLVSTVIDDHFWYGVQERTVSIALYGCDRDAGAPLRLRYNLRFHEPLDLAEFVHYVAHAKARIHLRRILLHRRLAELYALQFLYLRVLESPSEEHDGAQDANSEPSEDSMGFH
ncbi:hypothetical protein C8Q76DRAFT_798730 [Earliella scabrosa]|nr:hypothetical protein C8Q76DRAFT_798730 [Earliella scabrosa]